MRRLVAVCGAVAILTIGGGWAVSTDNRPECERAKEWVASNTLPDKLDQLTALPELYQRVVFAALSPEIKSQVFRERIQSWAAGQSLSHGQLEALEAVSRFASPESYRASRRPSASLLAQADEAFSGVAALDVFTSLGPTQGSYRTLAAATLRLKAELRHLLEVKADNRDCSVGSMWSCDGCAGTTFEFGRYCKAWAWSGCDLVMGGCGFLWMYPCDGRCCYSVCGSPQSPCLD